VIIVAMTTINAAPNPVDTVFSRVTVPLDLSAASDRAIPVGVTLANQAGVPIELVVVIAPGIDPGPDLTELDDRAEEIGGTLVERSVLQSLDVAGALTDRANGSGRLLCMATHGRTGIAASFTGSVAREVLKVAREPVLLVGPHVDQVPERFATIVVGVDPAAPHRDLVTTAASLARILGTDVHLVTIEEASHWLLLGHSSTGPSLDQLLDEAADLVRAAGVAVTTTIVRVGSPAPVLADMAARRAGSLLAMSSKVAELGERTGLGAVATRVTHMAGSPVLFVPGAC
jgi:nucleotide-binding universal stress UspA family protein